MIYEVENMESVRQLFDGWEETLIWSCLQGIMGKVYVTNPDRPVSAIAAIGDFVFCGGEPGEELAAYRPYWCKPDFRILVPQNAGWERLIEQTYGKKAKRISRYAVKKEKGIFDQEKLRQAAEALPEGYSLCLIDERRYKLCGAEAWSADLVAQFQDYPAYKELGLGVVIMKNGELIAGASSYSRYREGIEIEIDTKEEYRRKGFAYICGAKLILECLERNLYPSWDAHNKASAALAEKLGYHLSHEYKAYEIYGILKKSMVNFDREGVAWKR